MLYVVTVIVLFVFASPWVDYGDRQRALRTSRDDRADIERTSEAP